MFVVTSRTPQIEIAFFISGRGTKDELLELLHDKLGEYNPVFFIDQIYEASGPTTWYVRGQYEGPESAVVDDITERLEGQPEVETDFEQRLQNVIESMQKLRN